jgi:hypothetical protein
MRHQGVDENANGPHDNAYSATLAFNKVKDTIVPIMPTRHGIGKAINKTINRGFSNFAHLVMR